MSNLQAAIILMGRKASGKSALSKELAKQFDIPVASFGGFLKNYCESNDMPSDTKNLQDLGEEFIKNDPGKFLQNVISYSNGESEILIFDGVRHLSIFEGIKSISKKSITIFIDEDQNTRFKRYMERNKEIGEEKGHEQFMIIENHAVEKEIDFLKPKSDLIFKSPLDNYQEISDKIKEFLVS